MAHRQWQESNSKGKLEAYYYNSKIKYEQMSKQQQLIEQKKQEIQKRLEEKKKKETEEALKKLSEGKQKTNDPRAKRNFYGFSKNKSLTGRDRVPDNESALPANIFSNDGSFLQQFQKISGIKVEVKKRSYTHHSNTSESTPADIKNEANYIEAAVNDNKEGQIESHEKSHLLSAEISQQNQSMQQQMQSQQGPHMIQPHLMQQHHQILNLQPPLHQQVFTPQQMPMPPMNFPPHFNPIQCGMMLPPPMAPSSIPPPAPMNPGLIPSPSPLQPCSIPSPSPIQPYAIPPPSPLLPHCIPPPSPMVPHSIPPPSPLTPHSIPPPLPLRPQNIPPPVQHPPIFLSMAPPPPPPPPPEEEKLKNNTHEKVDNSTSPSNKPSTKSYMNIEENVKDLLKNDEYSSSSDEDEQVQVYGPPNKKQISSDSDSECERQGYSDSNSRQRYSDSNSDKESDNESDHKIDSHSELDSEIGQESQPAAENESVDDNPSPVDPIVIEDTQTHFPSDMRDSSNSEKSAPPDISSEGDSLSNDQRGSDSNPVTSSSQQQSEAPVKQELTDIFDDNISGNITLTDVTSIKAEPNQELKTEIKEESVKYYTNFVKAKQENVEELPIEGETVKSEEPPKKKRKSRWATNDEATVPLPAIQLPPTAVGPVGIVAPTVLGGVNMVVPPLPPSVPIVNVPGMSGPMISKLGRSDPALVAYAMKSYGHSNLSEAEWKKVEDHYKINLLYQDMMRKREELERLQAAGKNKYEYDSDEDTHGGTWEHKLRSAEMEATQLWADELTEQAKGKHHIGDFLPPDELARFMEKYEALKDGREPDLSDYKEFKLREDNVGFQMLQKLGWTEGQGLGPDGTGIMDPVNKAVMRPENQGLGVERPEDVEADDDEYDAYRKRMMLAYRFRPNPMNNPRRPYY